MTDLSRPRAKLAPFRSGILVGALCLFMFGMTYVAAAIYIS